MKMANNDRIERELEHEANGLRAEIARLTADRDRLRAALARIATLVESEDGEPLDEAIAIANHALEQ